MVFAQFKLLFRFEILKRHCVEMDSRKSALLYIILEDTSSDESSSDELEVQELLISLLPYINNERENIPKVTYFMEKVVSNYSDIEVR